MKTYIFSFILLCAVINLSNAQVILNANSEGNTYEDINAVLAPNHDVVEVPD